MTKKLPPRDPVSAYVRKTTAARRIGRRRCACGETRPEALIARSKPMTCAACQRTKKGITTMDNHHVAGAANNPTTIAVPVNDHRAELNTAQQDWPKQTRENPDGSPLLAGAGCVRGFVDTLIDLIKRVLLWIPHMLETLDGYLRATLGPRWWLNTELAQFAPR
jgi:hypothetical protein